MASFLVETLVSTLMAPVLMLFHVGAVLDVLRGRDAGWRVQRRRGDGALGWAETARRLRWHMVVGVAMAVAAAAVSWHMLAWVAPVVAGLVASVPLVVWTGSVRAGRALRDAGLLLTSEEAAVPPVAAAADAVLPHYREIVACAPGLADIARDGRRLARHLALTDRPPHRVRGDVDPVEAVAEQKIRDARTVEEAVGFLAPAERARVQSLPALVEALAALPSRG